ncbi:MAG: bifunctional phosphoribosylaminoimidazolecarboxamide formyltransferase/IMP cyclohydrolase, partial [Roseococcus sp.]
HAHVVVLTEPAQFATVQAEIAAQGGTTLGTRKALAAAAYARTAAYDAAISGWFAQQLGEEFPPRLAVAGILKQTLRYGENPHQQAGFYLDGTGRPGIATATQVQGKELSYNNLNDTDAAFECVAEFDRPAIVIVKHANPCGVAVDESLAAAWDRALLCDPVSAFGGIVAANRTLDAAAAEKITAIFTEVVIAPDADEAARAIFARKKNLRLLLTGGMPDPSAPGMVFRSVAGGFLAQSRDAGRVAEADLRVVTKRAPSPAEMADLLFAFRVCKHVKSNAIIYAKGLATVGIGAGQMNRVESSRIAAWKSEAAAKAAGLDQPLAVGSVVASDAFFPFADGLETAAAAGVTAVIQPGGSMRDAEVIAAADAAGLAMVFTGMRHFRH